MNKVLIIGCCGAGKSTFSKRLAAKLNLPIIHLDQEYWQPGWVETPKPEWEEKVSRLATREKYIMDGNYASSLDLRLKQAGALIYLDYPTGKCIWRVIKRIWKYHGKKRPDMTEGCNERFDLDFLHYVLVFNLMKRKSLYKILDKHENTTSITILKNDKAVDTYFANL